MKGKRKNFTFVFKHCHFLHASLPAVSHSLHYYQLIILYICFKDFDDFIEHFILTNMCIEMHSDLSAIYEPKDG